MINHLFKKMFIIVSAAMCLAALTTSCDDTPSYAELLTDEDHSVNRYLVDQRVVGQIPADSVFEVGPDAPYYQIDEDGTVYMQILEMGDGEKAETGDRVYMRFMRYNLNYYEQGETMVGSGNADDVSPDALGPAFFVYNDMTNYNSQMWGSGLQMPMRFINYNGKVNVVIKSRSGLTQEQTSVVPYLYTVSYYKPLI